MVAEGKYFNALCLFARVDSYESMLNQIGCLVSLHDNGYAVELYFRLIAKYFTTHNCYHDLSLLGSKVTDLLGFFDKQLKIDEYKYGYISADATLLANYDDYNDYFDEEDFFEDYEEYSAPMGWCDVRSTEYFFRRVRQIQEATESGQFKKSHEIATELIEFESSDEAVLEAQMLLCLAERKFDEGVKFAEKLASLERIESYRATAIAVGLLSSRQDSKDSLEKLMTHLVDNASSIEGGDLLEYMELAEGTFDNAQLLTKLAELIFTRYEELGCESLKACSRVFCNMGLKKTARNATLKLINALPWDSYAPVLLRYIDSSINAKLDNASANLTLLRHVDVPTQLGVIAQFLLIQRMEESANNGGDCLLYASDYALLDCIIKVCKTHIYRGNSDKFVNDMSVLSTLLTTFTPQNVEEFYDFAKQQLCCFSPSAPINKDILLRLIQLGCREPIVVSAYRSRSILDLSHLRIENETFLEAFSLCAVLKNVDTRRLQHHYDRIRAAVDLDKFQSNCTSQHEFVQKLAYCLLAVTYKSFAKSSLAEYFGEGEDELYLQYNAKVNG